MSTASPGAARGSRGSVVILGADAFLAALPATPTQLANACFAAGYDDVVPASWGDELLAVGCLDQLAAHDDSPAIACICPLVREQLRGANGLNDATVRLVSPPVAAALYIRATAGDTQPRITYVGDCPGGGHPSIDIHLSPAQLQSLLAERGIVPGSQRPVNGERAPRDRRRHYSLPGGVPAPQWLGSEGIGRTLIDLAEISTLDQSSTRTFVDFAPRLGCVCSGALAGGAAEEARSVVMALEPPRARDEVVDHAIIVPITDETPARTTPQAGDVSWPDFVAALAGVWSGGNPAPMPASRVPTTSRPPVNRPRVPKRLGDEGRVLPRAYQTRPAPDGVNGRVRARGVRRAERDLPSTPATPREERPPVAGPADVAPASRSHSRPTPTTLTRMTGVRHTRTALASTDRWLLLGIALAASVMVAVLTSVMTVRGLRAGPPGMAAVSARETVFVAGAASPSAGSSRAAEKATVGDTPPEGPAAGSLRSDSSARLPTHDAKLAENPAPPVVHPRAPVSVRARERHHADVASTPSRSPVTTRPKAEPTEVARTTPGTSGTASTSFVTTSPAAAATTAPSLTPAPVRSPVPAAPAPTSATATRVQVPLDSAAQSNAEVLQELRAIRNEIESRKRHVDSLSRALDSLGKVKPSR